MSIVAEGRRRSSDCKQLALEFTADQFDHQPKRKAIPVIARPKPTILDPNWVFAFVAPSVSEFRSIMRKEGLPWT